MTTTRLRNLLLLGALLLPGVALAQDGTLRDDASGLQVTAPEGYAVQRMQPSQNQAARFRVQRASDTDTGCQVAFVPAPQNNALSQDKINQTMRSEVWQQAARQAVSPIYDIRESSVFHAGKREGFVMVGDFKERPDFPPRAREIRTLFVIQETPKGRTSTVCVGERNGFAERQPEFIKVAEGALPP